MAFTGAIKVKDGTITSSPNLTPANFNEICKAAVPFIHAITYFALVNLHNFFSKSLTNFPAVEIQFVSIHFLKYFQHLLEDHQRVVLGELGRVHRP